MNFFFISGVTNIRDSSIIREQIVARVFVLYIKIKYLGFSRWWHDLLFRDQCFEYFLVLNGIVLSFAALCFQTYNDWNTFLFISNASWLDVDNNTGFCIFDKGNVSVTIEFQKCIFATSQYYMSICSFIAPFVCIEMCSQTKFGEFLFDSKFPQL